MNGGSREYNESDETFIPITGSDITIMMELEYINDDWLVKHVWDSEQLMKNKNEIQRSLIHHIVDNRLQDETLVTDLIDSIISFTPYQQKQLHKAQEQLQMLQKDAGKKLHDNEIEIRKQSLELMREKKRSTDLESELLSMQGIADSQNTHIRISNGN